MVEEVVMEEEVVKAEGLEGMVEGVDVEVGNAVGVGTEVGDAVGVGLEAEEVMGIQHLGQCCYTNNCRSWCNSLD